MADVTLTYKGNTILELDNSATKSIKTAGKYLEDDIGLNYVKSGGSGSGNNILKGSSSPVAGIGQDGDVYLQYSGNQNSIVASFVKVNGTWQALVGSDVDDVIDSGMYADTEAPPPSSLGSDGDYYYQKSYIQKSIISVNTSSINGSNERNYGTKFAVTAPVTVTHLFARTTENRTGKMKIGTISQILAETENVQFPANEWVEVPLASPIQLSPGTNYLVKVFIDSTYSTGRVAYVQNLSNIAYDSLFSYVGTYYGTSWPGTQESGIYPLVCIGYAESGLCRIVKQFHKDSGSWSEIA